MLVLLRRRRRWLLACWRRGRSSVVTTLRLPKALVVLVVTSWWAPTVPAGRALEVVVVVTWRTVMVVIPSRAHVGRLRRMPVGGEENGWKGGPVSIRRYSSITAEPLQSSLTNCWGSSRVERQSKADHLVQHRSERWSLVLRCQLKPELHLHRAGVPPRVQP